MGVSTTRLLLTIGCVLFAVDVLQANSAQAGTAILCLSDQIGVRLADAPFVCGRADANAISPEGGGTTSTLQGLSFHGASPGEVDVAVAAPGGLAAHAMAQGDFGVLRAFGQGTLGDWTNPALGHADSLALAEVSFGDGLKIVSSTLPTGTPVDLSLLFSVGGAFGTSCCGGTVRATVSAPGYFVDRMTLIVNALSPTWEEVFSITSAKVGDVVWIRLGIRATGGANNTPPGFVGFADLLSTGEVFAVVNTPGASFVSDSGATYTVPEPTATSQILAGLLVLVWLARAPRRVRSS